MKLCDALGAFAECHRLLHVHSTKARRTAEGFYMSRTARRLYGQDSPNAAPSFRASTCRFCHFGTLPVLNPNEWTLRISEACSLQVPGLRQPVRIGLSLVHWRVRRARACFVAGEECAIGTRHKNGGLKRVDVDRLACPASRLFEWRIKVLLEFQKVSIGIRSL